MYAEDLFKSITSRLNLKQLNCIIKSNAGENFSSCKKAEEKVLDLAYDFGIKYFVSYFMNDEISDVLKHFKDRNSKKTNRLELIDSFYTLFEKIGLDEFFQDIDKSFLPLFANKLNVCSKSSTLRKDLADQTMYIGSALILESLDVNKLKELMDILSKKEGFIKNEDIKLECTKIEKRILINEILSCAFKGAQIQITRLQEEMNEESNSNSKNTNNSKMQSKVVTPIKNHEKIDENKFLNSGRKSNDKSPKRRKNSKSVSENELHSDNEHYEASSSKSNEKHLDTKNNGKLKENKKKDTPKSQEKIRDLKSTRRISSKSSKSIESIDSDNEKSEIDVSFNDSKNEILDTSLTKEIILEMRKDHPIQKGITKQQLHDFYWAHELKEYCKQNNIPTHGKKTDIMQRIIKFLETGTVSSKKRKRGFDDTPDKKVRKIEPESEN